MESNVQGNVPISSLGKTTVTFTVGFPEVQLDCLPERKSFRANIEPLTSPSPDELPVYLCLNCRQAGHIMEACPYPTCSTPLDWTTAKPIDAQDLEESDSQTWEGKCERCRTLELNLDSINMTLDNPLALITHSMSIFSTDEEINRRVHHIYLGPAASVRFKTDCAFCRLLFSIIKCPDNGTREIVLTTTSSNMRLGMGASGFRRDLAVSAYPLTVRRRGKWGSKGDIAMAAISYVSEDYQNYYGRALPLGGRWVSPFFVDTSTLLGWLKRCEKSHRSICRPEYSDKLQEIRLVDVELRQIVPFPLDDHCDYIALSYVWGKLDQKSYKLGSTVEEVPQTIEDAMHVVKQLGKRFLWVDSLTIDQSDSVHKGSQIKLMSVIYSGAWATIVALAGRSSAAGLPRVQSKKQKLYPDMVFPQTFATHNGVRVVSTMPTLDQEIQLSWWATRAWTFQEALLSPRCLYFTQHQVYFHCNIHQCCEAIDDSTCSFHNEDHPSPYKFGEGVLRSNFQDPSLDDTEVCDADENDKNDKINDERPGLERFFNMLSIYSSCKMTYESDKLNAFSGVLQALDRRYFKEQGCYYGFPISQIPTAICWQRGQKVLRRLNSFPSWSWAGWESRVCDYRSTTFGTNSYLQIFKPENESLVQIVHANSGADPAAECEFQLIKSDPLWHLASQHNEQPCFSKDQIQKGEVSGHLFVEGVVLSFMCPDFDTMSVNPPAARLIDNKYMRINSMFDDQMCVWLFRSGFEDILSERAGKPQNFLVLARVFGQNYQLMLLDEVDGIAYRKDVFQLCICSELKSSDEHSWIKHANPQHKWLILG